MICLYLKYFQIEKKAFGQDEKKVGLQYNIRTFLDAEMKSSHTGEIILESGIFFINSTEQEHKKKTTAG